MKKILFILTGITVLLFSCSYTQAKEQSDYEVIQNNTQSQEQSVLSENNDIQIVSVNDKLGIKHKSSQKYILTPQWDEIKPLDDDYNEFKLVKNDKAGYLNIRLNSNFVTPFDDIYLLKNYLKVKNKNKYGIIDKQGNVILQPEFQRVGVFTNQGTEYITGKIDGKYRFYQNTGRLIPEDKLYVITSDSSVMLANDLKPVFKTKYGYKSSTYIPNDTSVNNNAYQIEEMNVSDNVKLAYVQKNVEISPYDIQNVKITKVQKNTININNKQYIITKQGEKIGLNNPNNKEILPPVFDSLKVTSPCIHFNRPVILAKKQGFYMIYDLSGCLLAEEKNDKINVYNKNKTYTFYNKDGYGNLYLNNKLMGIVEKNDNGYKFKKKRFTFNSLHSVTELILTILPVSNL